ncbi:hypothetical protein Droror1_Dr00023831 [Drosera rotundifolia]
MAQRLRHTLTKTLIQKPSIPTTLIPQIPSIPNPNPFNPKPHTHSFSTSFLITKTPKKFKQKRKKPDSPRTNPITHKSSLIPHFERIVERDHRLRFLIRSKQFISKLPNRVLRLDDAGKLYRELGFPRGRKVTKFIEKYKKLFEVYRHCDGKMWIGFTELMEGLVEEEKIIIDGLERERVIVVKKLLMMSKERRMPLSKIYHCRGLFGVPEDFRDWVLKFEDDFRVVNASDGTRMLELVRWDPELAVTTLEKEFVGDEEKVRRAFRFRVKYGKSMDLEVDDVRRLDLFNTLPLVSPYSDGSKLDLWTLEAEKYRVGVLHEFLSLTLEKRASIHHIVEFKEEFSLTKHTYQMLLKQPRTFYLAGTEMNWAVFLRDAYDESGNLKIKDPLVLFCEKLYKYAEVQDDESSSRISTA